VLLLLLLLVLDVSADVGVSAANVLVLLPETVVRSSSTGLQNNHRNKSGLHKVATN